MPEDGEKVFVTYDETVIKATWDLMRYRFYDTNAVSLDKDFVCAWMPSPKPYKAERAIKHANKETDDYYRGAQEEY